VPQTKTLDPAEGFCRATFRIAVDDDLGGLGGVEGVRHPHVIWELYPELRCVHLSASFQEVIVELDFGLSRTRYPFEPPTLRVLR
jgi:hypothetical protein